MSGLIARALGVAVASAVAATGCAGGNGDCRPTTPTIAFDSAHADNIDVNDIYLIDGDGTNRRVLVEDAWSPDWSPDGCSIAFVRDGVYVVSATGGRARRLTHDPPGASSPGAFVAALAAWSPDGDQIALELYGEEGPTAAPEGVYYIDVLNSGGSDRHRLVPFQAGEPSWSPGGDRIAVTRYLTIDTSDVYVVDAGGSNLQRLTRRSNRSPGSNSPSWSPDGSVIAFVRWPDQHNDLYTGAEIYLVDAAGGRPRRVTSVPPDSPGDGGPAWSPDGKRIAFARESTEGITDVYIVNRDGSALRRLTRTGDVGGYAWSPDGRTIVFSRAVETGEFAEADLYVAGADGRGLRRLTKTPRLTEDGPTWAPQ
jgi:Tol biopolymer transport system component